MPQSLSTYIKGMNQDVSYLKSDPAEYFSARNFKLVTDTGSSTAALVNEKGMKLDFCLPDLNGTYLLTDIESATGATITIDGIAYVLTGTTTKEIYEELIVAFASLIADGTLNFYYTIDRVVIAFLDDITTISTSVSGLLTQITSIANKENVYIIGWAHLNDDIVIISTANDGNGQIWRVPYDEKTNTVNVDAEGCIYASETLKYSGCLDLHTDRAVTKIEARYETTQIARIYWTDNYNPVRSFNLNDPQGFAIDCDDLSLTPNIKWSQPVITDILDGGNIPYGSSVQMGYRLQGINSLTVTSPLTPILPLYSHDDEGDLYKDIKSDPIGTGAGKAIQFTIDNIDTNYDTIEYIFLIYETDDLPTIVSFTESISPTGSITQIFTYSESDLTSLTIDEVNDIPSEFNIAKDIVVKDNRLIAANLTLSQFEITDEDFDARAYRFKPDGTSTIFQSNGTSDIIPIDYVVDFEHDAINPLNNPLDTNYTSYSDQLYQSDGTTLGGEGKQIKYSFITKELVGDERGEAGSLPWSGMLNRTTIAHQPGINTVSYNVNNQFNNYTSPFVCQYFTGYQRDEVYRFAIVFYSKKGEVSFAKWIGDIKFPTACQSLITNTDSIPGNKTINSYPIGVEFTVNIPDVMKDKIQAYEIVRLERTVNNISRWGGGVVLPTYESGIDLRTASGWVWTPENAMIAPSLVRTVFPFMLFRDNTDFIFKNGDYLKLTYAYPIDYASGGSLWEDHFSSVSQTNTAVMYYRKVFNPDCYAENITVGIEAMRYVPRDGILDLSQIDSSTTYNEFINETEAIAGALNDNHPNTECAILALSNNFPIGSFANGSGITGVDGNGDGKEHVPYVTYCRDLAKQYGGNTYESRSSNSYISTGVVTFTNSDDILQVFGGDTYTHYYMHEDVNNPGAAAYADKAVTAIGFPCESPFNADLRRGNFFQKDRGAPAGAAASSDPYLDYGEPQYAYTDIMDQYNYGKQIYIGQNFQAQLNKEFPYTIWASELKTNGELIDSWGSFQTNDRLDVEGIYGGINSIHNFKDRVFFYQDRAFGAVTINERVVIPDANGLSLVIGKGDVVSDYGYVSKHTGCSHRTGVVTSENYIYHFDVRQNKLWQYDVQSKNPLSDVKGLSAFFHTLTSQTALEDTDNPTSIDAPVNIIGAYEHRYNRVLFTLHTGSLTETISFNELFSSFESFYDYKPKLYLSTGRKLLSVDPGSANNVYQHDEGDYCKYYNNNPSNSIIELIINGKSHFNKTWGNLEWLSELTDSNGVNLQGTYETLQISNDYQDTGAISLTEPDTIKRRFRAWRHAIQRDILDIGSEAKISNPWIHLKLDKDNSDNNRFVGHDIISHYLVYPINDYNV